MQQLNPSEISEIIKQRIEKSNVAAQARNEGTVVSVSDGIVRIYGLADVMYGEMIEFPGGIFGINAQATDAVEKVAPGVIWRKSVDQPVQTGYKSVDAMIPVGRGQRELIIGDRQIGKTALAIDAIINQKNSGIRCVYVAIGQKQSTIANVVRKLEEHGALQNTIVVAASASESAALQYLAPYAGCTMGEYFRDRGEDALIVYDDLSKQAVAYRQISLLLRRPPGREAYPGDVSAFVPTNVISITDGQIFLESAMFNAGIRPAVNAGISVSRVGGAAQTKIVKKLSGGIRTALAQYRELAAFAQFASDLDEATRKQLEHGQRVTELMKQKQYAPMSIADMSLSLYAAERGYLADVEVAKVGAFEQALIAFFNREFADLMAKINVKGDFNDEIDAGLKAGIEKFKATQSW